MPGISNAKRNFPFFVQLFHFYVVYALWWLACAAQVLGAIGNVSSEIIGIGRIHPAVLAPAMAEGIVIGSAFTILAATLAYGCARFFRPVVCGLSSRIGRLEEGILLLPFLLIPLWWGLAIAAVSPYSRW